MVVVSYMQRGRRSWMGDAARGCRPYSRTQPTTSNANPARLHDCAQCQLRYGHLGGSGPLNGCLRCTTQCQSLQIPTANGARATCDRRSNAARLQQFHGALPPRAGSLTSCGARAPSSAQHHGVHFMALQLLHAREFGRAPRGAACQMPSPSAATCQVFDSDVRALR